MNGLRLAYTASRSAHLNLEGELAAHLNEPRYGLPRSLSEVAVRQIDVHVRQVRMIENIEDLKPELEGYRFPERCVLQECCIPLLEVW